MRDPSAGASPLQFPKEPGRPGLAGKLVGLLAPAAGAGGTPGGGWGSGWGHPLSSLEGSPEGRSDGPPFEMGLEERCQFRSQPHLTRRKQGDPYLNTGNVQKI